MKNKQKQAIIIVALVILLAVFWSIKKGGIKKTDNSLPTEDNQEVVDQEGSSNEDGNNSSSFNKAEFDKVMVLASNAYNNKEYQKSIDYYKKALSIKELDVVYGKMYLVYLDMKDYKNASMVLDKALSLNPAYNQYWFWKIELGINYYKSSFAELDNIYKEAYGKVEITAKINLVTFFATIADQMGQKQRAIEIWKDAIRINPAKKAIYQAEIDRLSK